MSGTMVAAHLAGIHVFVTGGLGGVHRGAENCKFNFMFIHHNFLIIQLRRFKVKPVLAKQLCCIQTKMYRLYRKMTINGHFVLYDLW